MVPSSEAFNKVVRLVMRRTLRNIANYEIVLSVAWGILGHHIPPGTLMAAMNVGFLVLSLILAWEMAKTIRFWLSPFVSGALSAAVWVLVFTIFRAAF